MQNSFEDCLCLEPCTSVHYFAKQMMINIVRNFNKKSHATSATYKRVAEILTSMNPRRFSMATSPYVLANA